MARLRHYGILNRHVSYTQSATLAPAYDGSMFTPAAATLLCWRIKKFAWDAGVDWVNQGPDNDLSGSVSFTGIEMPVGGSLAFAAFDDERDLMQRYTISGLVTEDVGGQAVSFSLGMFGSTATRYATVRPYNPTGYMQFYLPFSIGYTLGDVSGTIVDTGTTPIPGFAISDGSDPDGVLIYYTFPGPDVTGYFQARAAEFWEYRDGDGANPVWDALSPTTGQPLINPIGLSVTLP